jgi:hypothetical protein
MKRHYKIDILKIVDQVFREYIDKIIKEQGNMDFALERKKGN